MLRTIATIAAAPALGEDIAPGTDYPTTAVGDYITGCMAANGEDRAAFDKCACSIDEITTLIPYSRYEETETFLSIGLTPGERGAMCRTIRQAHEAVGDLRRAQIEAELRCF